MIRKDSGSVRPNGQDLRVRENRNHKAENVYLVGDECPVPDTSNEDETAGWGP
ncbi:hypothetical protein [Longibacter salinarum]|uniref:hypothetical protein n=1 Tax=Longibacter salinarum TaxID=1850348 RepID=UPI0015CF4497|nr:hypothetical protein [Longibacter salinarum]